MSTVAQTSPPSTPAGGKRPTFWRRKIVRAFEILIALLVLIIVVGEIIFSTDLPRNLMVNVIEKQLGLRVSAKSLSTGWLGYTTLRDVTITLPLADKAFLTVPVLKINHSWIPTILFGGSLTIHEISIDHARLEVLQEPRGTWNIQEVVQLLGRAGGGKSTADQSHDIPTLPALNVTDASLVIADNNHRIATIEHLAVTGTPSGPLLWEYHATIPDHLELTGKVAPGGIWAHEVSLLVHNVQSWTSPWIASWPESASLQAHWFGQVANGQLVGRINLEKAVFRNISVSGPIEFAASSNSATFRPTNVLITDASARSLDTRLDDGQIVLDSDGIRTQQLALEIAGGNASVDGKFTFADTSATVHAAWRDVAFPASSLQSGNIQIQYIPTLGQPRFNASLQNHGSAGSNQWDADLAIDGTGNTLKTLSLALTAKKLRFDAPKFGVLDLSGLVAQIGSYPSGLLLEDLRLGSSHPLSGQGGYSIADHTAWLSLDGNALPIPADPGHTIDADLNIWSNPTRIHLQQFFLHSGPMTAYLNGDYVSNLPKPLKAHAYLVAIPPSASLAASPHFFRGSLLGSIDLNGTVAPMDLALTGSAVGQNIRLGQRPIGDLKLDLLGTFRDNEISVSSKDIQLLGGNWAVSGHWPARHHLFRIDNLSVEHLSIPKALASDNIAGTLDGKWTINIDQPTTDGIEIDGSTNISNLIVGNPQGTLAQYLTFDKIQISSTKLKDGSINLGPVTLIRKIGPASGQATGTLATSIHDLQQLSVGLTVKDWPVQPKSSKAVCLLSGKASVAIDLQQKAYAGHADLSTDTSWNSQHLGQVQASVDLNHRQFLASSIQINSLNGTAQGSGSYDIDHPYASRLNLKWSDMDLTGQDGLAPMLNSLSGKMKGSLDIQPSTDPRALEPLAINLQIVPDHVQYRSFNIGDFQAMAFLGPHRFVLDNSPTLHTQVAIAGGHIRFWGRVSCYDGPVYQSLLQVTLDNLDLDKVLPAGAKSSRTPGILSGEITVVGRPKFPGLAFGQGSLTISQSDLGGLSSIAFLYNLMHVGHNASKPTGVGRMDFTLQNESVTISAMRYFDRGIEIRLSGQIADLLKLPHSPIALTAVGSARPLTSIGLPDFADIDVALGAVQHDALNVKITGYLDNPRQQKIPFADLGQDMRSLLFGDAQTSTNGD